MTFRLAAAASGDQTVVQFGHQNGCEAVEFTAHCSMKWATFLLSLRALVETGKGGGPEERRLELMFMA